MTGLDCGDEVADWLELLSGKKLRLMFHPNLIPGHSNLKRRLESPFGVTFDVSLRYFH